LFALTHLHVLHLIVATHPTYVFPSLVDDMLIVGPTSNAIFIFLMIVARVFNIRTLSVTNEMCSLVSTRVGLLYIISFWFFYSQFGFLYFGHTNGIQIIIESFVVKALHEDLGTIFSLLMFINTHMAFAMFSLCYVQCPSYLFCIVFPSPNIL